MRAFGLFGTILLVGSCSWGTFDDLKKDAWVAIAERDDSDTGGDFGIEILAMPPESGKDGIRYVIAVGNPPAGMAQVTFNGKGDMTDQIGYDAEFGGKGQLEPLNDKAPAFSMAQYGDNTFIAGVPDRPMIIRYVGGLDDGLALIDESKAQPKTGRTVVVGNLGLGSANPDVVAIGNLSLTVLPSGGDDPTKIKSCNLKPPNPSNAPVVAAESLALARLDGTTDTIVVSSYAVDNTPRILLLKAADIVNGQDCPNTGFTVADPPPVSIAVGDVDMDGKLDLIGGALATGGREGVVTVYPSLAIGQTPTPVVIPVMSDDNASNVRGSRLRIANIDENAANEIIVSDSGSSTVNRVSTAGQVQIYRTGACGTDGGVARGGYCLVRTLFDPSPSSNDQFGRALSIGRFKGTGGEKTILAVAEKAKLWVFFRTSSDTDDPRK